MICSKFRNDSESRYAGLHTCFFPEDVLLFGNDKAQMIRRIPVFHNIQAVPVFFGNEEKSTLDKCFFDVLTLYEQSTDNVETCPGPDSNRHGIATGGF